MAIMTGNNPDMSNELGEFLAAQKAQRQQLLQLQLQDMLAHITILTARLNSIPQQNEVIRVDGNTRAEIAGTPDESAEIREGYQRIIEDNLVRGQLIAHDLNILNLHIGQLQLQLQQLAEQ